MSDSKYLSLGMFLAYRGYFYGLAMAGVSPGSQDICILVEILKLASHRVRWVT